MLEDLGCPATLTAALATHPAQTRPPARRGSCGIRHLRSAAAGHLPPQLAGCRHRWWVKGWEICRSYQNCASRRDWHGRGSQAAQPGSAQLILVRPSGVLSSTGRCIAVRRWWRAAAACMSLLLPSRSGRACWPVYPASRVLVRLPSQQGSNGGAARPGDLPKPARGTKEGCRRRTGARGLRDGLRCAVPGTSLIPSPDLSPARDRTHLSRLSGGASRPAR